VSGSRAKVICIYLFAFLSSSLGAFSYPLTLIIAIMPFLLHSRLSSLREIGDEEKAFQKQTATKKDSNGN